MATEPERELRTAFGTAGGSLVPDPRLADRVRKRVHRRRQRLAAAMVLVVLAGLGTLAAVLASNSGGTTRPAGTRGFALPEYDATQMAVDDGVLYVASGDYTDSLLTAYDAGSGTFIRRVHVPARASSVRFGGGYVWLSFYPSSAGGRPGVWRLLPDLSEHSWVRLPGRRYQAGATFDVLPTGADTAVFGTDEGVADVQLPAFGSGAEGRLQWRDTGVPLYSVGLDRLPDGAPVVTFAGDGGQTAVGRLDRHAVLHLPPSTPVAVDADGVWANAARKLTLYDTQLRQLASYPLTDPMHELWAAGHTLWWGQANGRLGCARYRPGESLPRGSVSITSAITQVTSAGDTVYVATPSGLVAESVPVTCR